MIPSCILEQICSLRSPHEEDGTTTEEAQSKRWPLPDLFNSFPLFYTIYLLNILEGVQKDRKNIWIPYKTPNLSRNCFSLCVLLHCSCIIHHRVNNIRTRVASSAPSSALRIMCSSLPITLNTTQLSIDILLYNTF